MDDRHSGLRPLGPYGEGYCRVCHFVIALDERGRLEHHSRGAVIASTTLCKGGRRKPPKLTPLESYKARFRSIAPVATCPFCMNSVMVLVDGRLAPHKGTLRAVDNCKGSFRPAERRPAPVTEPVNLNRNHSAERGV